MLLYDRRTEIEMLAPLLAIVQVPEEDHAGVVRDPCRGVARVPAARRS